MPFLKQRLLIKVIFLWFSDPRSLLPEMVSALMQCTEKVNSFTFNIYYMSTKNECTWNNMGECWSRIYNPLFSSCFTNYYWLLSSDTLLKSAEIQLPHLLNEVASISYVWKPQVPFFVLLFIDKWWWYLEIMKLFRDVMVTCCRFAWAIIPFSPFNLRGVGNELRIFFSSS